MLASDYVAALLLFIVASLTDVLDGFLARRYNWGSRFGAQLDPIADKALLVSLYITLLYLDYISIILVLIVVGRDILILLGSMLYRYRFGPFEVKPSLAGKLCTFSQVVLIWALLTQLALSGWIADGVWISAVIDLMVLLVIVMTLVSGAHYLFIWGRRAQQRS